MSFCFCWGADHLRTVVWQSFIGRTAQTKDSCSFQELLLPTPGRDHWKSQQRKSGTWHLHYTALIHLLRTADSVSPRIGKSRLHLTSLWPTLSLEDIESDLWSQILVPRLITKWWQSWNQRSIFQILINFSFFTRSFPLSPTFFGPHVELLWFLFCQR